MEEEEFRRAFREHKDSIYAFTYRLTGSSAAADDLTQDCFLELFLKPERFDPERGPLRSFLLGIARNLVLKRCRRENRFQSLEDEGERLRREDLPAETGLAVAKAMQALSPLQREAVVLFEYEGLTLDEIARMTGADVGTVKSRLFRARENLRTDLAPLRTCQRGVSL
jgi:RNA polymerase sigma-70 factor, ECF subfamily